MTINKIEERKPTAVAQPLWTTQPPPCRWDELSAAFPPAPAPWKPTQAQLEESYRRHTGTEDRDEDGSIAVNPSYEEWAQEKEIMDGLEAADCEDEYEMAINELLAMDSRSRWNHGMDEPEATGEFERQAAEQSEAESHALAGLVTEEDWIAAEQNPRLDEENERDAYYQAELEKQQGDMTEGEWIAATVPTDYDPDAKAEEATEEEYQNRYGVRDFVREAIAEQDAANVQEEGDRLADPIEVLQEIARDIIFPLSVPKTYLPTETSNALWN